MSGLGLNWCCLPNRKKVHVYFLFLTHLNVVIQVLLLDGHLRDGHLICGTLFHVNELVVFSKADGFAKNCAQVLEICVCRYHGEPHYLSFSTMMIILVLEGGIRASVSNI